MASDNPCIERLLSAWHPTANVDCPCWSCHRLYSKGLEQLKPWAETKAGLLPWHNWRHEAPVLAYRTGNSSDPATPHRYSMKSWQECRITRTLPIAVIVSKWSAPLADIFAHSQEMNQSEKMEVHKKRGREDCDFYEENCRKLDRKVSPLCEVPLQSRGPLELWCGVPARRPETQKKWGSEKDSKANVGVVLKVTKCCSKVTWTRHQSHTSLCDLCLLVTGLLAGAPHHNSRCSWHLLRF